MKTWTLRAKKESGFPMVSHLGKWQIGEIGLVCCRPRGGEESDTTQGMNNNNKNLFPDYLITKGSFYSMT